MSEISSEELKKRYLDISLEVKIVELLIDMKVQ